MSNPTSNFGWVMPDPTDLVTNLPADFEVFGQAVDTTLADLKGGTTGQVLKKNTNTDMDFVWSSDSVGMTNPMTTTGDTIYSSPGSTPVRLPIGSTGQGLSVVAGIPAWTASATSTLTTTGDTLYASAANTLARRAIGTTGQVLTVAGGIPTWATLPASSPGSANSFIANAQSTTSSTYTDLATVGPTVTLTTGTKVLIIVGAYLYGTQTFTHRRMSYAISGATTLAAADENGLDMYIDDTQGNNYAPQMSFVTAQTVTAGSNTFTAKYRQQGGSSASFANRWIIVIDLGS